MTVDPLKTTKFAERDKLHIKISLHPNNKHRERYNFPELIAANAELAGYMALNKYGDESIDFSNPAAVLALNKALLMHFYSIKHWSIPEGFLCPPIPGRAEYIHRIAEALGLEKLKKPIHCLDIGVGANCIYPIVGVVDYHWNFVGSDVNETALENAQHIIDENPILKDKVELRQQPNQNKIFHGIILPEDCFDLSICNPPFHRSQEEASAGSLRKNRNLNNKKSGMPMLNFGGQANELWCEGGEIHFIQTMIRESVHVKEQCRWFTTLISKQENLKFIHKALSHAGAKEVKTIDMQLGNKVSRIVAWRF